MKLVLAFVIGAQAMKKGYPDHLGEMFPNKESMYGNDWDKYKHGCSSGMMSWIKIVVVVGIVLL